jgi:rhamnosyltransferase subunit B
MTMPKLIEENVRHARLDNGSRTHFVVATCGTAGDMHPFLSLAKALQGRGHKVTFLAPEVHEKLVLQACLPFKAYGTRENYFAAINDPDLWDDRKAFIVLWGSLCPSLGEVRDFVAALPAGERCVVLAHPLLLPAAALARTVRSDLLIVGAYLAPINLRSYHDLLTIGSLRVPQWFPIGWRRLLWRLIDSRVVNPIFLPTLNAKRQANGLPPVSHFFDHMYGIPDLSLGLFPSWFCEQQVDWPAPFQRGEFQLYEPNPDQVLSPELQAFLAAGEAPIAFTPGTGHRHAASYFANALVAVMRLGRRAVFLTPHREQVPSELPSAVLWQAYVPFHALLPRVSALVHHGGIGTTAEALRAGIPQLVVPLAFDQFDNGIRVRNLGVGDSLPASRMHARNLTKALRAILSSTSIETQCAAVAARFSTTPDTEQTCIAMESALGVGRAERFHP